MSISVELPDGSIRKYDNSVNPGDVAADISRGLAKRAIGAVVDGQLWELNRELPETSKMELILENDERAPQFFRHTFSHILAQAVIRVYGIDKVRLGIGPVIENGFYYDFDLGDIRITEEDLVKIEKEMEKIIKEDHPVERIVLSRNDAKKQLMEGKDQDYKLELLNEFEGETFSFYRQGDFIDLCRGPHVPSTGRVKYFKLTAVSGAYWRGDESRPMLQRVYGTAFIKKSQLEEHLRLLEEAKKRDHRKLGPQLGLFTFNYDFAPGMPLFLPKGTVVLNELYAFSREMHTKYGYQEINTPLVMNDALWRTSGHWDHYQDNMYFTEKEDQHYALKPMNCPGHILVYKAGSVSYKDFPLKLSEFGKVHRYERSGVLHGLFRVRGFTQDDAHIFCTPEQIKNEIKGVIDFVDKIYSPFGFEYRAELSTRPEDFMGEVELWDTATTALKESLEEVGLDYKINEGDGAFYGPKIDYHIKDSLGREWQCATIQLDFMMPERFQLKYITSENAEAQPVMIHRAIFGSIERFMGILVENFAGAFPTWLAPVQASLLPIADRHSEYAKELADKMTAAGIRVNVDDRQKSTNYKVREAQVNKIPYMLVIGDKEIENSSVAVRLRNGKNLGAMSIEEFIDKIMVEVENRKLNSIFE